MKNSLNYRFLIFEIIPIEQFAIEDFQKDIFQILKAFESIGYYSDNGSSQNGRMIFGIKNKEQLKKMAASLGDDEYVWLVADFFENLLIIFNQYDVLFALASRKNPDEKGPFGRSANYISTEVGGLIYPTSIPRILAANALVHTGHTELGNRINCESSFPRETALSGDITFDEPPINYHDLKLLSNITNNRPLSILSSEILTSKGILDLLEDESTLYKVEIGKTVPLQLAAIEPNKIFSLFNHFTTRAKIGQVNEILNELLNISLHLNWEFPKDYLISLPKDKALNYALMQRERLAKVEENEKNIIYALHLLQKRFPNKVELLEWEINNIYSNIIRYSALYLVWKTRIDLYIQDDVEWIPQLTNLVGKLDWDALQKNNVASHKDAQQIIQLLEIDPGAALIKIRTIIEKMISIIYTRFFTNRNKNLSNMLHELNEKGFFPPIIYVYFNTLRLTGNIGAHQQVQSKSDVEVILPIFIRVVEWFIDFHNHKHVV